MPTLGDLLSRSKDATEPIDNQKVGPVEPASSEAPQPPKPIVKETALFRWAAESIPSDLHKEENHDRWTVITETNAIGVFDGVASMTPAQRALKDFERLNFQKDAGLSDDGARKLASCLEDSHNTLLEMNKLDNSSRLATTAAVGVIAKETDGYQLHFGSVGDTRMSIWHAKEARYEVVVLDDCLLRHLLAPASNRPTWVSKILTKHKQDPNLQLKPEEAAKLAAILDQQPDPSGAGPLAKMLFAERDLITQSLGINRIKAHIGSIAIKSGDRILFASDGVHDNLMQAELVALLSQTALEEVASAIALRARDVAASDSPRAKKDDVTAVVIELK